MSKVPAFLVALFLAGSASTITVEVTPYSTSITVPDLDEHTTSPLSEKQFLWRQALQSVPVFATGTDIGEVRAELVDRNLTIVSEWPGYLVVREGVPLIDLSGPVRENYLYGFADDQLTLGPFTFAQTVRAFVRTGLTEEHISALLLFGQIETAGREMHNDFAWLLATFPDERLRDGSLAVSFAYRAVMAGDVPVWEYIDTLAAAYAAAGDFESAVREQRRANDLAGYVDEGMMERLQLYENGQAYFAPLSNWETDPGTSDNAPPSPRASLIQEAAAGSSDAQWTLAVFYIENGIEEADGLVAPGVFWLKQAARRGHPNAPNEVGFSYLMATRGVAQDYAAAADWFRLGVDAGDAMAAFNLGRMLMYAWGVPRDELEATRLLEVGANHGISAGAFAVAFRYGEGLGQPPNYIARKRYLEQVEREGYGPADYLMDDLFFQRFEGAAAVAAALDRAAVRPEEMSDSLLHIAGVIEDAAAGGGETFTVSFADDITFVYPSEYEPYLIYNLIRITASLGSTQAQLRMAEYFEKGDVVQWSLPEADYWRRRAAQ